MLETAEELYDLISKHLKGDINAEEQFRLDQLISGSEAYRNLYEDCTVPERMENYLGMFFRLAADLENGASQSEEKPTAGKLIFPQWWRLPAAAAVVLLIALGGYFWFGGNNKQKHSTNSGNSQVIVNNDLTPGQFKARLTLSDGTTIVLDSAGSGKLAQQGNTAVVNKGGQIIYNGDAGTREVLYNTLTTNKGETYSLSLGDGSRVWLNSASSIRYPVSFIGNERKVEITGEAYFEVTHNSEKPFKVTVNGMEVKVLGTEFNVNGYSEELFIKTTLLKGRVFVSSPSVKGGQGEFLKPGQQAQVNVSGITIINDADLEQAIAWKNGFFQFNRDDLRTVMRQLSRWYDVEVIYEGDIPKKEFWGKIHRNTKASEVLKIFEDYKIHFRIDGKKIIVSP